jgi:hypothetical protein
MFSRTTPFHHRCCISKYIKNRLFKNPFASRKVYIIFINMIKLKNLLLEVIDKYVEEEASSIQGDRIIATVDDFENGMSFPPKNVISNIADKHDVGYIVKKYPKNQAIIFYNKSNPNSKYAIELYNRYMGDFDSLSNEEHTSLGKFFGYDDESIEGFIDGLEGDEFAVNTNSLKPQTIFQIGKTYELMQDIPNGIKFLDNMSPVIKKGDRMRVTDISPNPTNQFWMVSVDALNYPEKEYLDFRIVPPNNPSDKYDAFVFQNII